MCCGFECFLNQVRDVHHEYIRIVFVVLMRVWTKGNPELFQNLNESESTEISGRPLTSPYPTSRVYIKANLLVASLTSCSIQSLVFKHCRPHSRANIHIHHRQTDLNDHARCTHASIPITCAMMRVESTLRSALSQIDKRGTFHVCSSARCHTLRRVSSVVCVVLSDAS